MAVPVSKFNAGRLSDYDLEARYYELVCRQDRDPADIDEMDLIDWELNLRRYRRTQGIHSAIKTPAKLSR